MKKETQPDYLTAELLVNVLKCIPKNTPIVVAIKSKYGYGIHFVTETGLTKDIRNDKKDVFTLVISDLLD